MQISTYFSAFRRVRIPAMSEKPPSRLSLTPERPGLTPRRCTATGAAEPLIPHTASLTPSSNSPPCFLPSPSHRRPSRRRPRMPKVSSPLRGPRTLRAPSPRRPVRSPAMRRARRPSRRGGAITTLRTIPTSGRPFSRPIPIRPPRLSRPGRRCRPRRRASTPVS